MQNFKTVTISNNTYSILTLEAKTRKKSMSKIVELALLKLRGEDQANTTETYLSKMSKRVKGIQLTGTIKPTTKSDLQNLRENHLNEKTR